MSIVKFLTLAGLAGISLSMQAQNASSQGAGRPVFDQVVQHKLEDWVLRRRGAPDDWSHHHHVFSNPGTAQQATENGTFERWLKIINEPRFALQQIKRGSVVERDRAEFSFANGSSEVSQNPEKSKKMALQKDWSMNLSGGAATLTGTVSSNGATGTSSVIVDGVTLNASAPAAEVEKIAFGTSAPASSSSFAIGSITYAFSTSNITAAPSSGCTVYSAASATGATNLNNAVNVSGTAGNTTYRCATGVTANSAVTPSLNSSTVTLTAKTLGSTGFTFTPTGTTNCTLTNTAGTDGTTSGTNFAYWSGASAVSTPQLAANIASAMNANATLQTPATGVTATSSGSAITVTARAPGTGGNSYTASSSLPGFTWSSGTFSGGTATTMTGAVGAGMFPAKYSFSTTATPSCSDFVVYNTGVAGTATQASIVAYNNLYATTCFGAVPMVNWAYNTGGTILTSVVLSLDGTQLVFVHSTATGPASLVLLKWAAGSGTVNAPVTPTSVANGSYAGCTAPCITTLTFSQGKADTNSPPYLDYITGTLYVGDNGGYLHKFTGIFNGTPAEITSGWPVSVSTNVLTGPVYNSASTPPQVYVADSGGFLYSYNVSTSALVAKSSQLAASGSKGIVDAPLLDSSAGTVYVAVGQDGNTSTGYFCENTLGCNGVFRFPVATFTTTGTAICASTNGTSWTTGTLCGSESVFGVANANTVLYTGTFDNTYYTGTGTTGELWSCAADNGGGGGATPNSNAPKLVSSPMSKFTASSPFLFDATNVTIPLTGTPYSGNCSPITEIYTGTTDWIFLGVTANGNQTGCTGACLYNFNITSEPATATATAGIAATNGTSGIVVDNISSETGASQVYYSPLGNQACGSGGTAGCAVQLRSPPCNS